MRCGKSVCPTVIICFSSFFFQNSLLDGYLFRFYLVKCYALKLLHKPLFSVLSFDRKGLTGWDIILKKVYKISVLGKSLRT